MLLAPRRFHAVTFALLLLAVLAHVQCGTAITTRVSHEGAEEGGAEGESDDEPAGTADPEDESDDAPFLIVVELSAGGGARCAGSLVSLRTVLTTSACARGPEAAFRDMWALTSSTAAGLAPRVDGARRVTRAATAGAHLAVSSPAVPWAGAMLDLAVLELESPFGSAARTRPILMATASRECEASPVCHVARAVLLRGRTRIRIVDAAPIRGAVCDAAARHWTSVRDNAFCLTGPELCEMDRGAGVVCAGKLCGVVSQSAGAVDRDATQCGRTHAAQSVARWRRFLHCAHTLRACGRGDCAKLCSERQLLDESEKKQSSDVTHAIPAPSSAEDEPMIALTFPKLTSLRDDDNRAPLTATPPPPSHGAPTRTRTPLASAPLRVPRPASVRPAPLFEPNRPDFRAGEYGDNAVDYVAPADDPASPPAPTRTAVLAQLTPTGTATKTRATYQTRSGAIAEARRMAPRTAPQTKIARSRASRPPTSLMLYLLVLFI